MRFRWFLTIVAVAAVSSCGRSQPGPPGGMQFPPAAVELAPARQTQIDDASEYVATLKSLHSTNIQPQIDGQITQIFIKSGEGVKAGTPLFEIDPRRQRAAVSSQEAERAARAASVSYAQQQAQRATELYNAGAISRQELEQAETALKTAQADLESLQAQVQQQEVQLRYYTVTAPTSGSSATFPFAWDFRLRRRRR